MTVSYTSCVACFNQHRFRLELFKEARSVHLIVSSSLLGSRWWFSHSHQCQNGSNFPIGGTCWRQINHTGKRLRPGGITLIRHQALGASYKCKAALRSIKGIRMRVRVAFCTVSAVRTAALHWEPISCLLYLVCAFPISPFSRSLNKMLPLELPCFSAASDRSHVRKRKRGILSKQIRLFSAPVLVRLIGGCATHEWVKCQQCHWNIQAWAA